MMKALLTILFSVSASFSLSAQTVNYSSGISNAKLADGKKITSQIHMVTQLTESGTHYHLFRCPEGMSKCLNYTMKLTRGPDLKWKLQSPQVPGGKLLTYPAEVSGDLKKISAFSSIGKDLTGTLFDMKVIFFESGSIWKTVIKGPDNKVVSEVVTQLKNTDKKTQDDALKNKEIVKL